MENKINHIRCLIYLGKIDNELHENEKKYVRSVGERLGVASDIIEQELSSNIAEQPPLPHEEVVKFIVLDDLLNLMAADGKILESEIELLKNTAAQMGFNPEVVTTLATKIEQQLKSEAYNNSIQVLIKNELFKSSTKNYYYEKYN